MIIEKVRSLVKRYKTNDPFEIAEHFGIEILYAPLDSVNGCYWKVYGQKIIIVNSNQDERLYKFIVAHELCHALYHSSLTCLYTQGYHVKEKYERQAHEFATKLLMYNIDIEEDKTKKFYLMENNVPYEMSRYI
ncbi:MULTISPECIES: ImmA/IrrE family metallo-endopeptidase [Aerococcus]|uniref:ImmA/IrrE family metallo-endopeptidase n=1 Tax=Aerococcus TaxID=1375 RepID=UPI0005A0CF29|nr:MULTISPECIES: ImmA/IrrE family metallo-endopeptidase [Aerococcus]KAA9231651.1 ImmA/IrrE family metallo-endopeptidase [Aerococcus mictus]MCY3031020.1 ImmA/IrrE family metallo-endopeptidase [Aerococcus sp. Group 1]MCY3055808.1 ImmA/IrrE family metallo-endopeptidase [Aerococcus sp. Group 1]MCY3057539.1 ImmA/IrrE family metallo-endopeptidase [Aerococcus sp. Group 1]MCY3061562.1 ImmA/IrrE family metallo-endopeptidase [Aerococcus sp. Group 1]